MSENMTQLLARLAAVTERAERAEAELAKMLEQKPVAYLDYWKSDGTGIVRKQRTTGVPFFNSPVPAPAVPDWDVNIERIRDVMHMLGISIDESVECFYAALPTNINRMTLAMKRHLQELAGMTAVPAHPRFIPTPFIPDDDTRRNDAAQQVVPSVPEEWRVDDPRIGEVILVKRNNGRLPFVGEFRTTPYRSCIDRGTGKWVDFSEWVSLSALLQSADHSAEVKS